MPFIFQPTALFTLPMCHLSVRNTRDGSLTLLHPDFNQTFHSVHGAYTESVHVFLEASGAARLLAEQKQCTVLEVGLGTGLNFLLTADYAIQQNASLEYVALDLQLYSPDKLKALGYDHWLKNPDLWKDFLSFLEDIAKSKEKSSLQWNPANGIRFTFIRGDARMTLPKNEDYDIIYLDAFSPDINPELWTTSFFDQLRSLLKPGGRLSTYSAKSQVRRNLAESGFRVEKLPGPPGKREIIVAHYL